MQDPHPKKPPHQSIFLEEFEQFFEPITLTSFVDATLGAGGHSEFILQKHPEIKVWIGIDQDKEALLLAKARLQPLLEGKRAYFIHTDFAKAPARIKEIALEGGLEGGLDGIFFDIGVSSMQLDQAERGFSFRFEGPLDMRMNQSQKLTAREIVNKWPAKELERIFRDYGEEPKAKKAADMLLQARHKKPITTTLELAAALEGLWTGSRKHPSTRIFQAVRIAVNGELEQLESALPAWMALMKEGGRLGVISFHSLEDRIVKCQMRDSYKAGGWQLLTPKPLEPSLKEQKKNPRARSAKLRFIEKSSTNKEEINEGE